ncbi:hypothetical protein CC86DRAFT_470072 [Ophiobolus disseminans]|uniref:Gamma-glutamyltranspeptidase n=1 Tax=Ophiobolus disseminans TaxID=1469910 RepID=A0A6A6ZMV4_9PLEO|nr:hypothetical protein CC86DRAFT_470072 [Ophiobolus disseminans]
MPHRPRLATNVTMCVGVFVMAVLTALSYVRLSSLAHDSVYPLFLQLLPASQHSDHRAKGAVSSENRFCSEAGVDMLRAGGNAADAMVATVFCVGVIGMYHSGIGGGEFALVRCQNGTYDFVDFREVAPAAAFEEMFVKDIESSLHGVNSSARRASSHSISQE